MEFVQEQFLQFMPPPEHEPSWWDYISPPSALTWQQQLVRDILVPVFKWAVYCFGYFVIGLIAVLVPYIAFLRKRWNQRFAHRHPRFHPKSASYSRRPDLKPASYLQCPYMKMQVSLQEGTAVPVDDKEDTEDDEDTAGIAAANRDEAAKAGHEAQDDSVDNNKGKKKPSILKSAKPKRRSKYQEFKDTDARRGTARRTFLESDIQKMRTGIEEKQTGWKARLGEGVAEHLDLDHIYIRFSQYLFVMLFVYPNLIFGFLMKQIGFRLTSLLQGGSFLTGGLDKNDDMDPEIRKQKLATLRKPLEDIGIKSAAALFILNCHMMVYYQGKKVHVGEGDVEDRVIGKFECIFYGFDDDGKKIKGPLTVYVDLENKVVTEGYFQNTEEVVPGGTPVWKEPKKLSDLDILNFILFFVIGNHSTIHAFSNWACNVDAANSFVRRMSVISVVYNNFAVGIRGLTTDAQKAGVYDKYGKLRDEHGNPNPGHFIEYCHAGQISEGVPEHAHILELSQYSDFANFIIKVRNYFLNLFEKYKDNDFMGIDGEALFISTVLHSLDHATMGELIPPEPQNVAALVSDEFDLMAEFVRLVSAGLGQKLDGLVFGHFFHEASHPFYPQVYRFAHRLNPFLADLMRCTIIL